MSSKKIYTTVGLDQLVMDRLLQEVEREERSRSFIVEVALRKHFGLSKGTGKEEETHVNEKAQD